MKEIKAIVQPFMLTGVVEALKQIEGLPGLTVDRDVRGFGRTRGDESRHKIVDDLVEYVPNDPIPSFPSFAENALWQRSSTFYWEPYS